VVVGFTEPGGSRLGIGALLLATPLDGNLVYIGRVGTGLGDAQLRTLRLQLGKTVVADPRADVRLMSRKDQALAIWVEPKLIVEVLIKASAVRNCCDSRRSRLCA
jgi:bifunctional non-homologous end joining protein LigD